MRRAASITCRLAVLLLALTGASGLAACGEDTHDPRNDDAAGPPPGAPPDLDDMVLVPAGPAVMGYDQGKGFERPAHEVVLDAFTIDIYEVTNYQYRRFTRASGHPAPPHWVDGDYEEGRGLHPVTNVTWEDARAYAAWAGKRLPTEAEWEKACRGPEGRLHAYGNAFDVALTNHADSGNRGTLPVHATPAGRSPYGCHHMTGNVWEWVSDWFSTTYYADGQRNPRGPAGGTMHVAKGGSWTTDADTCRASFRCRSLPGSRWGYCGFRCARSVVKEPSTERPPHAGMVRIPEGHFLMGADHFYSATPERRIWLDAFWIDKTPVTNEQYVVFCRATGRAAPPHWHDGRPPSGLADHPVINVGLEDARAYAAWAGKALPTEAQWEKAARGTDGRWYPWGPDYDEKRCNTLFSGIGRTVPVGTYPAGASPYGVLGMCGNVWEWVEGRWDPSWYAAMPERNPNGARPGGRTILRGGTWSTPPHNARTFSRCEALRGARWGYCGFRCVIDGRAHAASSAPPR